MLTKPEYLELWRKGSIAWNEWADSTDRAIVDFCEVDFSNETKEMLGRPTIDFSQYRFPKSGDVYFTDAEFGEAFVNFRKTVFGKGRVHFLNCRFGSGGVVFDTTVFGDGDVNFESCLFDQALVTFENAKFGDGHHKFTDARFKDSAVNFSGANFMGGKIEFKHCQFGEKAMFQSLYGLETMERFSFEGASFEKLFTFSHAGEMGCPLDLRRTSIKHDVVVHDIRCTYEKVGRTSWQTYASRFLFGWPRGDQPTWPWHAKASNGDDSQCFRKLKELAVKNRNHAKALEFHIREIQSARGNGTTRLQDLGQFLYWLSCDYGRSVKRPLGWLVALATGFAGIFAAIRRGGETLSFWESLGPGLTYSISNMLAFIPTGRSAMAQSQDALFGNTVPYEVFALSGFQTVLAVILLFLLGLGLRNMYRV